MLRPIFALFLLLLTCLACVPAFAQTEPAAPATEAVDWNNIPWRRTLLMTAGAFIGVTAVNRLVVNPATAEFMDWLSKRLLVLWGALAGSRLVGAGYDVAVLFQTGVPDQRKTGDAVQP